MEKGSVKNIVLNRPIIGHEPVINLLGKALDCGRLAHAYLFVGPAHVGKTSVARVFAGALLGDGAALDKHPDFFHIERRLDPKTSKSQAGIVLEQILELRSKLAMGAFMGGWKVALLEDAHLMNKESANALLKSLEEPHAKTLLILLATSADLVMPTIRSRCQVISFPRVSVSRITEALTEKGVSRDKADLYARLSGGCPGIAIAYADDLKALFAMMELRSTVLGLPKMSITGRWAELGRLIPKKLSFNEARLRAGELLDIAAELYRDVALIQTGNGEWIVHVDEEDNLRALASSLEPRRTEKVLRELERARRRLAENTSPRAALEHFVLCF